MLNNNLVDIELVKKIEEYTKKETEYNAFIKKLNEEKETIKNVQPLDTSFNFSEYLNNGLKTPEDINKLEEKAIKAQKYISSLKHDLESEFTIYSLNKTKDFMYSSNIYNKYLDELNNIETSINKIYEFKEKLEKYCETVEKELKNLMPNAIFGVITGFQYLIPDIKNLNIELDKLKKEEQNKITPPKMKIYHL